MIGRKILKVILLASNFLVVAVLLLTLLGSVLSPSTVLFPAYFALGFPVTIFLNIAFVVFWIVARKWWFLLSLSVLISSASKVNDVFPIHIGSTKQINTDLSADSLPSFKLLSYNTMMSGKLKKHNKKKVNDVIQYIKDCDADIVCLQEFTVSKNEEYLTEKDVVKALNQYPYRHIKYGQYFRNNKTGVATFSKFPIVAKHTIKYYSKYNSSIYTDVDIHGKVVRVVNNHLESNRLTERDKAMPVKLKNNFDTEYLSGLTLHFSRKLGTAYRLRANQADAVAKVIAQSPYKMIVCGDFNDVPGSYAYTKVKGTFVDAYSETGTGFGWTFNERFYRFRIDYVFYDKQAFDVLLFETPKVDFSDHYPVVCQLAINAE